MSKDKVRLAIIHRMRRMMADGLPPKEAGVGSGAARSLASVRVARTPEYRALCLTLARHDRRRIK